MSLDLGLQTCKVLAAAVLMGTVLSNGALANSFYQGKTVTILVGTDVGGGFDVYWPRPRPAYP
jgi:tripartite-type tricarboxylate transporter receptor subunit TctC